MQQHDHVPTTPGEPKAPEIVPHAVRPEPGANTQAEDINIPLVALTVAFFGVFLLILVFTLQACFYNFANAEKVAKQVPQGGPGTELGSLLATEHTELYSKDPTWNDRTEVGKPHTVVRVSIDRAMNDVVKEYAAAQGPQ